MAVEALGTNPAVTGAIRNASRATGTDFQYLVTTAQVESGLNPHAAAPTSSARGLFQFIEQTWLATLKERGPALGYGQLADAIVRKPSGRYAVSDPRLAGRIMNLRNDPAVNALMAGAYTQANAGKLTDRLGRSPTDGELYVAHFLGSNGAGRLISLAEARPGLRADEAFPGPARANRSIFYDRKGRPRSVAEVYRVLVNRYAAARGHEPVPSTSPATQLAAVPLPQVRPPAASAPVQALPPDGTALAPAYTVATNAETRLGMRTDDASPRPARADQSIFFDRKGRQRTVPEIYRALVDRYYAPARSDEPAPSAPAATKLAAAPMPQTRPQTAPVPAPAFAPDGAELAQTYAAAAELSAPPREIAEAVPVFHGLFRSGPGNEPVAPVVSALWITPPSTAEPPQQVQVPQQVAAAPAAQDGTLSLFQDRPADARALFRGRG